MPGNSLTRAVAGARLPAPAIDLAPRSLCTGDSSGNAIRKVVTFRRFHLKVESAYVIDDSLTLYEMNVADFDELAEAEKRHFYKCEQCSEMVDMRQLDDVLFHETDQRSHSTRARDGMQPSMKGILALFQ